MVNLLLSSTLNFLPIHSIKELVPSVVLLFDGVVLNRYDYDIVDL